jgi:tetratricopeptide (TPR) repeat protein
MSNWTLEYVRGLRDAGDARKSEAAVSTRDETYHPQVALLSSFRLDLGLYTGPGAETLREDSVPFSADGPAVMLKDGVRRRVLRTLHARDALRAALLANKKRPEDELQTLIEAALEGRVPALEAQPPEQLAATLQVVDWFGETELAQTLPAATTLRAMLERESLLGPMRALVGTHFQGRTTELAALRAYIDDNGARRPPLLIFGAGGMGKSALVAKFILDSVGRLPLAYLDCDRPGIVAMEPVTLLAEIVRQLALQFPELEAASGHLRARWLARISADNEVGTGGRTAVTLGRESMLEELKLLLDSLPIEGGRLLLVIDTFEEVQHYARAAVDEIFGLLDELKTLLPGLRTVLAGRNPVPGLVYEPLEIGPLDVESAQAILATLGVTPDSVVVGLGRNLRGNPLSLRLAAELWRSSDGTDLTDIAAIANQVDLQGILYGRILNHVHDEAIRSIAHPGLILRRITPDIIARILAEPCGLGPIDRQRAETLFSALREEMSLVVRDDEGEVEAVRHRADVRRIMLRPLRRAQHDTVLGIERAAIAYYSGIGGVVARAEEIYHRLSLGEPSEVIEKRWMPGIEESLRSAVGELEGDSRTFLAARLGIELYDVEIHDADQHTWELVVARQASVLLKLDKPLEAVALLRQRSARLPGSPLMWLHAQALRRGGFVLEARQVARIGLGDLLDAADWWTIKGKSAENDQIAEALMDWYCGPDLAEPPAIDDFARQEEWLSLQQCLRRHAGASFAGRRSEISVLDRYVRSRSTAALATRPPLFVAGIGGSGKSALVSRYLLDRGKGVPFAWLSAGDHGESLARGAVSIAGIGAVILQQLSSQFSLSQVNDFAQADAAPDSSFPAALLAALREIGPLRSGEKPLVIVIDDLEQLELQDRNATARLYELMFHLQAVVPRLRPVFISRSPPPDLRFDLLTVGALDAQSADEFLAAEQVEGEARAVIVRMSGGNPFTLRLIVDHYHNTGELPQLDDQEPSSQAALRAGLLHRVIRGVTDPLAARMLPGALIVRRFTARSMMEILARPCGVMLASEAEAQRLFNTLSDEVALFVRDGDTLAARLDLRRVFLQQLREEQPDLVHAIDRAAIGYYAQRDNIVDRAEELYHRLAASEKLTLVERRWRSGVEPLLSSAVDEIVGSSRVYLADKLGHDLEAVDWLSADQAAWEDYAAARAGFLAQMGRMDEALELLRRRSARQPRSRLFAIEGDVLLSIGQLREALAIVLDGLSGMPDNLELRELRKRCEEEMGASEAISDRDEQDPAELRLRRLAEDIVRHDDRAAILSALAETLATPLDMRIAWRGFNVENLASEREPHRVRLHQIVEHAEAQGILTQLLVAALRHAPQSPLLDLAERRAAHARQPVPRDRRSAGFSEELIFNRVLLRRFIAELSTGSGGGLWLVDGPPGSGKSSTTRIVRRFAEDRGISQQLTITSLHAGSILSPQAFARELFAIFDWRWEETENLERTSSRAMDHRYTQMIIDRLEHHVKVMSRGHVLIIGASSPRVRISVQLFDMIVRLSAMPGLAVILIGMMLTRPEPRNGRVYRESLDNFSREDIDAALYQFMRDHDLDGDSRLFTEQILAQAEGAERYNAEVSRLARTLLQSLILKSEDGDR